VWPHQRLDGPFAGLTEKDMSKSKDTTKTRELTEAELAAVSGGVVFTAVSNVLKMSHAPMKIEVGL